MGRLFGKFIGSGFVQAAPTGLVNGTNAAFTISSAPASAQALLLAQNGVLLVQGVDYSISGTTITMTAAPAVGTDLLAYYLKQK